MTWRVCYTIVGLKLEKHLLEANDCNVKLGNHELNFKRHHKWSTQYVANLKW